MTPVQKYNRDYYLRNRERIKQRTAKYAKSARGKEVQKAAQARFRLTEKSREAKLRYKRSAKGKASEKKADRSPAGIARHRRYEQSPSGVVRGRLKVRRSRLKLMYGLTPEDYDRLCAEQGGKCKICKRVERLVVDHKIKGKHRGLLCNRCNVGIGFFKESIPALEGAISYLKEAA